MADRDGPQAGGIFLALGILGGTLIGAFHHQSSLGLLAGLVAGGVAAIAVWLRDRAKRG